MVYKIGQAIVALLIIIAVVVWVSGVALCTPTWWLRGNSYPIFKHLCSRTLAPRVAGLFLFAIQVIYGRLRFGLKLMYRVDKNSPLNSSPLAAISRMVVNRG